MSDQIYGCVSVKGASDHDDLKTLCLSFARKILGVIDRDELLDIEEEPLCNYGCEELGRICLDYQGDGISEEEALEGIGQEIQGLFTKETSFDGDTAHAVIEVSCWDDGCANDELFNAFCRFLCSFSGQDHYFENHVSDDGRTTVGFSLLHVKDKENGHWVSKTSHEVLQALMAMDSSDLIGALALA